MYTPVAGISYLCHLCLWGLTARAIVSPSMFYLSILTSCLIPSCLSPQDPSSIPVFFIGSQEDLLNAYDSHCHHILFKMCTFDPLLVRKCRGLAVTHLPVVRYTVNQARLWGEFFLRLPDECRLTGPRDPTCVRFKCYARPARPLLGLILTELVLSWRSGRRNAQEFFCGFVNESSISVRG